MLEKDNPLEKVIEAKVNKYAESKGMIQYKFTSPQRRSVPDRLYVMKGGITFYIEFKRKGEKPTPGQEREIARLRAQGATVYVVDNIASGYWVIDQMLFGFRQV